MTQHIIGALDGVIVTLSDSRTTFDEGPPRDAVVKYSKYPSRSDSCQEGALAAVVLVQGRANFNDRDDDGTVRSGTNEREAAEIVTNFLAKRSGTYSSLQKLGDDIWQHIMEEHWYGCPSCRKELNNSKKENEPACSYHHDTGFSLFVAGVNADEGPEPMLYQRVLGRRRGGTDRIKWPYHDTMANGGRAEVALYRGYGENPADYREGLEKYWDDLVDSFNRTAAMAPCTDGPGGTEISTVGGTIHSIIVDPKTGVTEKAERPEIAVECGQDGYKE